MSRVVRRLPDARRQLLLLFLELESISDTLGARFLAAAEATFERTAAMPGIGELWPCDNPRLAGLRCLTVDGFPNHLVFYRPIEGGIEILQVVHGMRDIEAILGGDQP